MNAGCIVATFFIVAYAAADSPIRIREGPYITKAEEGHHSSLGVVQLTRHCGGPGKVLQWRVEGCQSQGTCRLEADGQKGPVEYEFIPSQDTDSLGIRFITIEDGTIISVYERSIANSNVTAGQTYIVNGAATLSERLKGRTLTTQYQLYRTEDNEVETCQEADFEFY